MRRGVRPDVVTDQTSAHDPRQRLPAGGLDAGGMGEPRARPTRGRRRRRRKQSMAEHVRAMLEFHKRGVPTSTTATTSARWPRTRASATPSTSPASCPPTSARCSAAASARSAGRRCRAIPEDIYRTDAKVKELMPDDRAPAPLARHGARAHPLPGPAGAHLLGRARRPAPARPRLQRDGGARAS